MATRLLTKLLTACRPQIVNNFIMMVSVGLKLEQVCLATQEGVEGERTSWVHVATQKGNTVLQQHRLWPSRHLCIAGICKGKCCHFHKRKRLSALLFSSPSPSSWGPSLLSTTPPRHKGRETQQSNKVSLHLTWKCMWVCVLLSVGHNQKAKNLTQVGTLSESLRPYLRCLLSSFPMVYLIRSLTSRSSMWALSLIANRPYVDKDIHYCNKNALCSLSQAYFLTGSIFLKYASLFSKYTHISSILHSLNIY